MAINVAFDLELQWTTLETARVPALGRRQRFGARKPSRTEERLTCAAGRPRFGLESPVMKG
jgi:hypothetical protein